MRRLITLLCLSVIFTFSTRAEDIVVGSFNIEWFGHGNHPRSDEQIELLADYIKSLEIDVLACQEINSTGEKSGNGRADWQDLMEALGDDSNTGYDNSGSSQLLAFVWRNDGVKLSDIDELKTLNRESMPDTSKKSFPGRPLAAYVKSLNGGMNFSILTVHLYWSVDAARSHEATRLSDWAQRYIVDASDDDLIFIGDCNTKPLGSAYDQGPWGVRRELDDVHSSQYERDPSNHAPVSACIANSDAGFRTAGDWGQMDPIRTMDISIRFPTASNRDSQSLVTAKPKLALDQLRPFLLPASGQIHVRLRRLGHDLFCRMAIPSHDRVSSISLMVGRMISQGQGRAK